LQGDPRYPRMTNPRDSGGLSGVSFMPEIDLDNGRVT
jgi:hypothetical protein